MTILLLLHVLIVLGFTVRILLRDDLSPSARLAWFIVLNVLPYVGSLVYFLLGEIDLGHRADKRYKEVFDEIRAAAVQHFGEENGINLINPVYQQGFRYASSINGFHAVSGNQAKLMADAMETNKQLIKRNKT